MSYAQNLEDVILWRALAPFSPGFYIDVGANDPTIDSVTRGFYDLGWRGINIEPVRRHHEALVLARPRDVNLAVAVGNRNETHQFYESEILGWSTASAEVAGQQNRNGVAVSATTVPMQTLTAICESHAPADIHFLKIDVEGFEQQVLEGADFLRFRPWVVVVEAVRPGSGLPDYADWEPLLTRADYSYCYFDGLNRFYVANERAQLRPAVSLPPNIHDAHTFCLREGHYFSFPVARYVERIAQLSAALEASQRQLAQCRVAENALRIAPRSTSGSASP